MQRRLSIESRGKFRRQSMGAIVVDEQLWTIQQDSALEGAVVAVAEQQYMKVPLHRQMQAGWIDGNFADHSTAVFWARVAKLIPTKTKEACFLRYHLIIRNRVARFTVKKA